MVCLFSVRAAVSHFLRWSCSKTRATIKQYSSFAFRQPQKPTAKTIYFYGQISHMHVWKSSQPMALSATSICYGNGVRVFVLFFVTETL